MHLHQTVRRAAFAAALALAMGLALAPRAAPAHASPWGQGAVHVVQLGETLTGIAARYGVSAEAIAAANGIFNWNYIFAGQQLTIPGSYRPPAPGHGGPPPAGGYHVVRLGETLYGIAWQYGTSVSSILAANDILNPDYIYAGQRLVIPGMGMPPGHGRPPSYDEPPATCGRSYIVKPGDTLSGIAAWHGTTSYVVAAANAIAYPYIIYPGQSLHIPCHGQRPPAHRPPGDKPDGRPRPKPTARPNLQPAACAREVQIVSPREGEHVSGSLQIMGTADIANFQFYKLEYAMGHVPLDSAFASIGHTVGDPVRDGVLRSWYVGNMPAGAYTLRLTAVDNTGNFPRPCNVHFYIDR